MHLFECNTEDELKHCVKQHIHLVRLFYFVRQRNNILFSQFMEEKSPGLVNLLYSIILSKEKGVDRFAINQSFVHYHLNLCVAVSGLICRMKGDHV